MFKLTENIEHLSYLCISITVFRLWDKREWIGPGYGVCVCNWRDLIWLSALSWHLLSFHDNLALIIYSFHFAMMLDMDQGSSLPVREH